jgi:hypothetical protein
VHRSLTRAEARALTDRIKAAANPAWDLLGLAYRVGAWRALGYRTWRAYCDNEFATSALRVPRALRPAAVLRLAAEGMSTRAIAAAIGVGRTTVARTLSGPRAPVPRPDDQSNRGAAPAAQKAPAHAQPAPRPERSRASSRTPADQVVPNLVSSLRGMCQVIEGYELDPAINREQAAAWARDLGASLAVLRKFTCILKEYSRAE